MNLSTRFIIGLCLLATFSCEQKEDTALPAGILNEEKFAMVLTDFALSEGAANMNIKNLPIHQLDSAYAFDPLNDNNVRKGQYDSTVKYYSLHPEIYKRVYEKVLQNLSEMEIKHNAINSDSTSK